jgi:PAS domain S-box-containing protein
MVKDPNGAFTSPHTVQGGMIDPPMVRRNLQKMAAPLETGPALLVRWIAAENWPVVFVSENISRFGYTVDEFLTGMVTLDSIIHPDDVQRVSQKAEACRENGMDQFVQEYRITAKDGRVCWLDDRRKAERDREGNITHYHGVVLDITDRKTIEKKWLLAQYALDHCNTAIMRIQADASIAYVNQAACRQLGYGENELLAMTIADIDPQRTIVDWQGEELATLGKNSTSAFESMHLRKDGSRFPVEVVLRAAEFEDSTCYYAFVTDISECKRTEHPLETDSRKLKTAVETSTWEPTKAGAPPEAVNNATNTFWSHISHELRTPLNAIIGFSRLMQRDHNLTANQAENLKLIHQSGEDLLKLINGVLDMVRMDAGLESRQIQTFEQKHRNITTAGFDAVIQKPIGEKEISQVIPKHLELNDVEGKNQPSHAQPKDKTPGCPIDDLADLPMALLENIKQNALELDLEKINAGMDEIQVLNARLGKSLKALSQRYRYHDILDLMEKAIEMKQSPATASKGGLITNIPNKTRHL